MKIEFNTVHVKQGIATLLSFESQGFSGLDVVGERGEIIPACHLFDTTPVWLMTIPTNDGRRQLLATDLETAINYLNQHSP